MPVVLALRKVSKSFGAIVIANELDLVVEQGEAVGILGPNGAGKTTLLGLITGTLTPGGGRIEYEGRDIAGLTPERRCQLGIARAFQVPQPFGDMTVFENLAVAACFGANVSQREAHRRSLNILEQCGLADQANEAAGRLTLLNRKRLELARALATDPRLLLLDEIAGGLTEHECRDLVALIKQVHAAGVTIVWIEHVLHALLSVVARAVVLYQGRFIADGDPHDVIKSPKVAEIYMGIEADA
ncbi:ABC transporter ATP-binding protein [Methylocapsa sp. S129]|uniref:ABC transporter ATP-binding protein n=1 Tax=Methylocapsa sp. S129 TaxID=1641869 RepID=UPI00131C980F|nr:ABC transporter ATP-binding protein [Methylocapsa sp. S129]